MVSEKFLLLDGYSTRTLACVRSFGARGIPFAVGGHSRWDMSLQSRHARDTFVYTSPYEDVTRFIDDVAENALRFDATAIFPTSESAIMACSAHRDRLPVDLVGPTPEQIGLLFSKEHTLTLAKSVGVRVPKTVAIRACGSKDLQGLDLQLPVIIKASNSDSPAADQMRSGGGTVYVYTAEELAYQVRTKLKQCPEILVQEFIDGVGVGVSGIFNKGEPVALFGHRRIRESIITGGPSAVAESIRVEGELRHAATQLMRATDYTGPAMVEFKVDRDTGAPYLMEVNCRFWGSILLPMAAGLDLPFILWKVLHNEEVDPGEKEYRVGLVGRYLVGDTKHLLLALRGRPSHWTGAFPSRWQALRDYFSLFFAGNANTLLLTRDDPKPFFGRLLQDVIGRAAAYYPNTAKEGVRHA